jgi:hypothetical protein
VADAPAHEDAKRVVLASHDAVRWLDGRPQWTSRPLYRQTSSAGPHNMIDNGV